MMKWNVRTEVANIGAMDLDNLTYSEDYMQLCLDILDMSDKLKAELEKAVEIEKVRFTEKRQRYIAECTGRGEDIHPANLNYTWSGKPVVMDFNCLFITLKAGQPVSYCIGFGFHDAVDDGMEAWDGCIEVDLSVHVNELKEAVTKMIIDKFF